MSTLQKVIAQSDFKKLRQDFRERNKTVVLCHGVFDLLHYGHIEHLNEAKAQGDILVVSITASKYVNKGPGRPYFNDQQRMSFLANIECVDYVMLSESPTVHDVVENVQPDIYVKGAEYADARNDVNGNISSEQEIVERYGGRIYFTSGEVHSSTKLLNNFFGALPDNVIKESQDMRQKYGANVFDQIRRRIDAFSDLNVLVVGDITIDEYVFCKVQGVTRKDFTVSTLYDSSERYTGGFRGQGNLPLANGHGRGYIEFYFAENAARRMSHSSVEKLHHARQASISEVSQSSAGI